MKNKCQIFTPIEYVKFLLNTVNYKENLFGKTVLENSCGEGNILLEIVERYIKDCMNCNFSIEKIKEGLENDIYGYEIDSEILKTCIKKLDELTRKYNIINVNWNIKNEDFLTSNIELKFSYIIGNPPYIKYKSIESDTRIYLKENFQSCKKGKFDYCYPFIEKSIELLKDKGKLSYLIPNSIFKNVFGSKLRDIMKKNIIKIYDYKSKRIFQDALTTSAIIVFDKSDNKDSIEYVDVVDEKALTLLKKNMNEKWFFSYEIEQSEQKIFSDYFTASISIATLYNKAFVVENVDGLEGEIVRPAASPKYIVKNKKEYIIFPYYYKGNILQRYEEEEFKVKFPLAYNHLEKYKDKLDLRKVDKKAYWHEYGRSQALKNINQEKLILSTVVTDSIKVFKIGVDVIPYSGIYITKNKGNNEFDLEFAINILKSKSFLDYVEKIGTNVSGNSYRITVKDINNFCISSFIYDKK